MSPLQPTPSQQTVISFLSDPASYEFRPKAVSRIETHCAVVFLAGDFAYKLKRAIRYSSLDYTTRDLRQRACEAELRLNRRTAPELYVCARSINRMPDGRLGFDRPGEALDHVVVVQGFSQADLFERMADSGRLTRDMVQELGAAIARLHLMAETTLSFGGSEGIRRVIADNHRELARVAQLLDGASVSVLGGKSQDVISSIAPLLDQRRADGNVRRGHGDLRLANACLYRDKPTLFDCIEFSDEISCIDTLYDLAFLLMDLALRGRNDLCNAAFNAYLDLVPETGGLRVGTRSYARAGSADRRTDPDERKRLAMEARRYIEAGLRFLMPERPRLITLGGDVGLGKELASQLAASAGSPPGARLLRAAAGGSVWPEALAVLRAGCRVLIEGVAAPQQRAAAMRLALGAIVPFKGLWCGLPPADLEPGYWRIIQPHDAVGSAMAGDFWQ
jgi:aminoglycoside phosphotransferase family enzyme